MKQQQYGSETCRNMQMTGEIEHLREAIVLQETKTATKWLERKLLMVRWLSHH